MGIQKDERETYANILEVGMTAETLKLLNLASDWVQTLLPHVLSKINRVSFGILTPADLAVADPRMPYSRRVMAVPFVGKDVPSDASEFSHPDVVIGLSILAYRYEGCRETDYASVIMSLQAEMQSETGPYHKRVSWHTFAKWVALGLSLIHI